MRRALWASALLSLVFAGAGVAAWTEPYTYRYEMASCPDGANPGMCIAGQACPAGVCGGTAPTGPSEGMILQGVRSFRLRTCASSGQTLSGAGTMQAYWRDEAESAWLRNPGLDVSITATGKACQAFPDFVVGPQIGRVRYVASAVTVSGSDGGVLDVLLDGYAVQH